MTATLQLKTAPVTEITTDILISFFYSEQFTAEHDVLTQIKQLTTLDVTKLAKDEKFEAKAGQTLLLRGLAGFPTQRVLLVGLGASDDATVATTLDAAAQAAREARGTKATTASIALPSDDAAVVEAIATGLNLGAYQYTTYMTSKEDSYKGIKSIDLLTTEALKDTLSRAQILSEAVALTRDVVNMPPQDLYPESFAQEAIKVAEAHGLEHTIFDDHTLEEKGFNLLMAVGKGSDKKPRLIHLTYTPDNGEFHHTIAFVGKGVTFDTGGNNIKTGSYMYHMHSDMAGGGAVLGAAKAIGALKPAGVKIHFLIAAAENSVSGNAMRPNDIYRGYGDKTVEIGNTDAEGRLCLADALAYAEELGSETIIDLATLTGACVVALGDYTSGMFTDSDELYADLQASIAQSGEDFWRLPLHKKLDKQLDSQVADMKNIGGSSGGAITAALFLKRWVTIPRWAHFDIAAPAYFDSPKGTMAAGGTGFGVTTLVNLAETIGKQK